MHSAAWSITLTFLLSFLLSLRSAFFSKQVSFRIQSQDRAFFCEVLHFFFLYRPLYIWLDENAHFKNVQIALKVVQLSNVLVIIRTTMLVCHIVGVSFTPA